MKARPAILILLAAFTLRAFADATADFDAANKLQAEGKYAEAAAAYGKLIQTGNVGPALFFNFGNAEFKAGQLGRAIAAYRRAEALTPRDPDVRANLQFARNQFSENNSARPGVWQRSLRTFTVNEWSLLAAAAVWACLILLALGQWRGEWQAKLKSYAGIIGLAAVVSCGVAWAAWFDFHGSESAVVTGELTVRSGPLEEATGKFTARNGLELAVLDKHDDWLQVSDGQGRIGWVKRDALEVLKP